MVEEAFSIFLGAIVLGWFLGDLAIWLFFLKGHPWRRKVLLELLFLLPAIFTIFITIALKPFEKTEPSEKDFYISFAMLVLYLTAITSFHLWVSSTGAIFIHTFYFYLKLYFKGVGSIKEELWREIDKQIGKRLEFLKKKKWRLVHYSLLMFMILGYLYIIAQFTYLFFFKIPIFRNAVFYPVVSGDDKYVCFILLSRKRESKETLMIASLPKRRIVYEHSYDYEQTKLEPLGWLGDAFLVQSKIGREIGLLVLRKEGKKFKSTYEKLPPYKDLYILGSHLYAIKEEKREIVRLERKDGKWAEESVFPLEKAAPRREVNGWVYDSRYHPWEIKDKPAGVIAEARWKRGKVFQKGEVDLRKVYVRLGIKMPGERAKMLREFEVYVEAIGRWGGFSDSKDSCYFFLQRIDTKTGRYLPSFLLFEITADSVKERELKWDVKKFAGKYELCATRNGYLLFYPSFISSFERVKQCLLFLSPSGEKKFIEWKYGEISDATALNNEDKTLLFGDKGIFLVDNLSCSMEKIIRFP